jgi:hypothetical protein
VHLPRETDAGNFFSAQVGTRDGFADSYARSSPPIFRLLLSPTDLRRSKWLMLFRSGGDDTAMAVNDEGAGSSGTNVNP